MQFDLENYESSNLELMSLSPVLALSCLLNIWPASVAQLDARPTGDQEVVVQPPPRSATFFRGD